MTTRTPIGHVEAVVKFPLYDGDDLEGDWPWFEYAQPGVTDKGTLGVCRRTCETLRATVVHYDQKGGAA